MRLAHLTDLHLPIPVRPPLRDLLNKRALGYLSWSRNRRFRHTTEALDPIIEDCRLAAPDFTAISGDLVNISLECEFLAAVQWVEEKFDGFTVAFAPGNHDAYVRLPWDEGAGRFGALMAGRRFGDDCERAPRDENDFPFVRSAGAVSLVFANSSPPTAPGLATGRLGKAQIERIGVELEQLADAGQCRVLVVHHPVTEGATPKRKALDDGALLRDILSATGVELVLHGHTHRSVWASVETKDGPRPVVGGASASHPEAHGKYRPARYNLFSIEGEAKTGWRISVEVRELDPASGDVKTAEHRNLLPFPA
ncbi:MAG: metallophosphoesterase family protein [Pseudomonadota bacterium]